MSDESPMKPGAVWEDQRLMSLAQVWRASRKSSAALESQRPSHRPVASEGQRPGHMPAQGNALGSRSAWVQALKGRPKGGRFSAQHGSPLQGLILFHGQTQGVALGWHGLGLWPTEPESRKPQSPEPEAPRKLAGGANHRNPTHNGYAPAGAAELDEEWVA